MNKSEIQLFAAIVALVISVTFGRNYRKGGAKIQASLWPYYGLGWIKYKNRIKFYYILNILTIALLVLYILYKTFILFIS